MRRGTSCPTGPERTLRATPRSGPARTILQRLRSLYDRIGDYRRDAGVKDDEQARNTEEAIFGDPPEDDVLRMRRRVLVEETLPREDAATRTAPSRTSA